LEGSYFALRCENQEPITMDGVAALATTERRIDAAATQPDVCPEHGRTLLDVGEVVGGNFIVSKLIAVGGMAQVFEAKDIALGRRVALKVADPMLPPERVKGIAAEARALAAVRHPNIVTVHAIGSHRNLRYIVMELVPGMTLAARLDDLRARGAAMPVDEAVEILGQVADALGALHQAGIAHRDVKPANIILAPGNRVVITDLGIFTPEVGMGWRTTLTGTPEYMAPEILRRSVAPGLGHLLDIYALGVMAFEMMVGDPPASGATIADIFHAQLTMVPPPLRSLRADVPVELERLVSECVAKDPRDRPPSAEAVAWRLRELARRARSRHERPVVLIVDDDPDMIELMRVCVERCLAGAEVHTAPDAARALGVLRAHRPALILLDVRMPDMNGLELCMYLRGTHLADGSRIVSVSAATDARDDDVLRGLGVAASLRKGQPFVGQLTEVLQGLARSTGA
jgi:serine/threonine-protein kinase